MSINIQEITTYVRNKLNIFMSLIVKCLKSKQIPFQIIIDCLVSLFEFQQHDNSII